MNLSLGPVRCLRCLGRLLSGARLPAVDYLRDHILAVWTSKLRIKGVCMRFPGGYHLDTFRSSLVWARVPLAENLVVLLMPAVRGDVAPRHDSETVNTIRAALSSTLQPVEELGPDHGQLAWGWRFCVPCRCRCNVPVGADLCGLLHALVLCYHHHSNKGSPKEMSICMLHRTEPCF